MLQLQLFKSEGQNLSAAGAAPTTCACNEPGFSTAA